MQDQVPPDTPSSDPLKLPEHVLDALPGVLFVVGADGVTEFCGSAVIDVMGFSAAEFVATPGLWWQCLHPEDVRRIKKAFSEGTDKPRLGFDYRFQRKDGRYRWLRSELRRRILPDGTFSRELIGFTTDIEERIQREAARRKMEIERMRTERTLETVSKILFKYADINVLIPNQEWYYRSWVPYLEDIDFILVKTKYAEDLFKSLVSKISSPQRLKIFI